MYSHYSDRQTDRQTVLTRKADAAYRNKVNNLNKVDVVFEANLIPRKMVSVQEDDPV